MSAVTSFFISIPCPEKQSHPTAIETLCFARHPPHCSSSIQFTHHCQIFPNRNPNQSFASQQPQGCIQMQSVLRRLNLISKKLNSFISVKGNDFLFQETHLEIHNIQCFYVLKSKESLPRKRDTLISAFSIFVFVSDKKWSTTRPYRFH